MSSSPADFLFLQQLYGQDTLYVIPEPTSEEAITIPVNTEAVHAPVPEPEPTPQQVETPAMAPVIAETREEPVAAPAVPAEEIKWLGEAVHGTYLLFEVPDGVFGQLPHHAFLQKVMAAVGLNTGQIKFGNMSPALVHDVKKIAAENKARHIILFGQGLPVANLSRMEFYRMYRFEESRFVLVDSLEDIEKSVELKKKLWDVLQKIFLQQN
ncbi:hypothetical protein [Rufibacter hautae]|uniref:Uncharacterized protein n=1 Tax=Rufibacter hautae TaxID=2595005 RepID=A0A5B6TCI8_9BACT|nr:hypothetical protein [Rufibacter hautae]KAA3438177.1 hypothetical protein FOA19_13020 [Rufibacter hautae]